MGRNRRWPGEDQATRSRAQKRAWALAHPEKYDPNMSPEKRIRKLRSQLRWRSEHREYLRAASRKKSLGAGFGGRRHGGGRNGEGIDTTQFSGDGAVFGLLLASVRRDYQLASKNSLAYKTAKRFVEGGVCHHWKCDDCVCSTPVADAYRPERCVSCYHDLTRHWQYEYDWTAHRNEVIGSLGMSVDGLVRQIKRKRAA